MPVLKDGWCMFVRGVHGDWVWRRGAWWHRHTHRRVTRGHRIAELERVKRARIREILRHNRDTASECITIAGGGS